MAKRVPKRIASLLHVSAAIVVFAFTLAFANTASASCGDYLAGHHSDMGDGKVKTNASESAPLPCSGACENGRCQQAPVTPQREVPRVVSLREVARLLEDLRDDLDLPDHRWLHPTSSSKPCAPFLALASQPPECI